MLSSAPRQTGQLRQPTTRTPTVCVVDPQLDDYQGWEELAAADGLRLQFVANAEEAFRFARSTAVDLWVVNTELSRLSGCELCTMLKVRSPDIPVYLVADEYSPEAEQAAWKARATLFGCKGEHSVWLEQWNSHRRQILPPAGAFRPPIRHMN